MDLSEFKSCLRNAVSAFLKQHPHLDCSGKAEIKKAVAEMPELRERPGRNARLSRDTRALICKEIEDRYGRGERLKDLIAEFADRYGTTARNIERVWRNRDLL